MKKTLIATVAVASIIIIGISCKWFAQKADKKETFNIVGKWQVDTVMNDSNALKNAALYSSVLQDSGVVVKFNIDSTLIIHTRKDSIKLHYYLQADTLYLKQDTAFVPYTVTKTNDSLISTTLKDGLFISLKRQ